MVQDSHRSPLCSNLVDKTHPGRGRLALRVVLPRAEAGAARLLRAARGQAPLRRGDRPALPQARGAARRRQEAVRGQRGGGARARVLGLGDRVPGRGHAPLTARRQPSRREGPRLDASPGPAHEPFLWAARGPRPRTETPGFSTDGPGRRVEMR